MDSKESQCWCVLTKRFQTTGGHLVMFDFRESLKIMKDETEEKR